MSPGNDSPSNLDLTISVEELIDEFAVASISDGDR